MLLCLDFSNLKWGDKIENLKGKTPVVNKLTKYRTVAVRPDFIGKVPVMVEYHYVENELAMIIAKPAKTDRPLEDFDIIVEEISKGFNKKGRILDSWTDTTYKEQAGFENYAIAEGYHKLYCMWDLGTDGIRLTLKGRNGQIEFKLEYYNSKMIDKLANADRRAIHDKVLEEHKAK